MSTFHPLFAPPAKPRYYLGFLLGTCPPHPHLIVADFLLGRRQAAVLFRFIFRVSSRPSGLLLEDCKDV